MVIRKGILVGTEEVARETDLLDHVVIVEPRATPFLECILGDPIPMTADQKHGMRFWNRVIGCVRKVFCRLHVYWSDEECAWCVTTTTSAAGDRIVKSVRRIIDERGYKQRYKRPDKPLKLEVLF